MKNTGMKPAMRILNLALTLALVAGAVAVPNRKAAVAVTYPIHDIQGAGHSSPLADQEVTGVEGIVIAVNAAAHIFYMQAADANMDADPYTSEGVRVSTGTAAPPAVGSRVLVSGRVLEMRETANDLTVTTIDAGSSGTQVTGTAALPSPVAIGDAGRTAPTAVIDDDSLATFDPDSDGIDFYETFEGMRVAVQNALAVSGTSAEGEIVVVEDNGGHASSLSPDGALVVSAGDMNPERIILDDALLPAAMPAVSGGSLIAGTTLGVLDYRGGNYRLLLTAAPGFSGAAVVSIVNTPAPDQLTVATFDLSAIDSLPGSAARRARFGQMVVTNLKSPDIIAVQGALDNNGVSDDGVTAANQTFAALINAIDIASSNTISYQYAQIDPLDDHDGGPAGGNSRLGFLYRPERVSFVARGAGGAADATQPQLASGKLRLSLSPGRVDPANPAFANSPKLLAGEFTFQGFSVFVINAQLADRSGDVSLFGAQQPPVFANDARRIQQAQALNDFVHTMLALDPFARVVVLGETNDDYFSPALDALQGVGANQVLTSLYDTVANNRRYTAVVDGNARAFDQMLVSHALLWDPDQAGLDFSNFNTTWAVNHTNRSGDSDPLLARLEMARYGVDAAQYPEEQTVALGERAVFNIDITNPGNAPDSYTFSLSGNVWGPLALPPVQVAAGETRSVTFFVDPPLNAPYGAFNVLAVTVTSSGDPTQAQTFNFLTAKAYYDLALPLVVRP